MGEILEFVGSMQPKNENQKNSFSYEPFLIRSVEVDVELDRIDEDNTLNKDKNKMMNEILKINLLIYRPSFRFFPL